jgi:hypothetical protein
MSLTFHRTFSLSRSSVSKVIQLALNYPGFKQTDLAESTDLGTVYQEAMPRYAVRSGLLSKGNYLTELGRFVAQYDSKLERTATQWLMHYHLCVPHGSTAFWHFLVRQRFVSGNVFSADDLLADLSGFLAVETGKVPAPRSMRSTVTIFTGTYLKSDGLRRLGLLEEDSDATYRVPAVDSPEIWALGYALADYWSANYNGRLTINLDDLVHGDFAAIFLLGEDRLMQLLLQLKQEGMVDLYRISRPYQIVLLQPSIEYALQKLYEG